MPIRAFDLFQGGDWMTYRQSVAQVYDTLDRMREVCVPLYPDEAIGGMNDLTESLLSVHEIWDDLCGEIDLALADLTPVIAGNVALRWMTVELRAHLAAIRAAATPLDDEPHQTDPLNNIAEQIDRIKTLLKSLDHQ